MCTELSAATSASQTASISAGLFGFGITITPVEEPTPDQFQASTSQLASFNTFSKESAKPFGSGPGPRTYIAALVPGNFDNAETRFGLSKAEIPLGSLNLARAACASSALALASAARAFASAVSFRNWSPWVTMPGYPFC